MQLSEKDLLELAGWQALKHARTLVSAGSVATAVMNSGNNNNCHFKGEVIEGRRRYVAALTVHSTDNAQNHCNCIVSRRDGQICSHSIAVALTALNEKQSQNTEKPREGTDNQSAERNPSLAIQGLPIPLFGYDLISKRSVYPVAICARDEVRHLDDSIAEKVEHALQKIGILPCKETGNVTICREDFLALLESFKGGIWPSAKPPVSSRDWPPTHVCSIPARIPLTLCEVSQRPEMVRVELNDTNETVIVLHNSHCWILRKADQLAIPTNFEQINPSLRAVLEPLLNDDPGAKHVEVEINVLKSEAESLFDVFHMECSGRLTLKDLLQSPPGVPDVSLEVEGSLRQLSLRLKFAYPANTQANPEIEFQTLRSLPDGQWKETTSSHSASKRHFSTILRGESAILDFYAGSLDAALNSGWDIKLGPRFTKAVKDIEKVRPLVKPLNTTGDDWLSFDLQFLSTEGHQLPEKEIRRLLSTGISKIQLPGGKVAAFDRTKIESIFDSFGIAEADQTIDRGSGRPIRRIQKFFFESLIEGEYPSIVDPPTARPLDGPPPSFQGKLRNYQNLGVDWLFQRSSRGYGSILADEMGLGKTVQILALISVLQDGTSSDGSSMNKGSGSRPVLIVCPTSLMHTWQSEIDRFLPNKKSLVLHGAGRKKLFPDIEGSDIVITSYGSLTRDLDDYPELVFSLVVADEASILKNPGTQVAKALARTECRSRIALSGTPVENSVQDLWSIMTFVNPGYLEPYKEFLSRYGSASADKMKRLNRRIGPFVLRRTKNEVASELPGKIDKTIYCELNTQQRFEYEKLIKLARNSFNKSSNGLIESDMRRKTLVCLLRLRQVCCDSRLLERSIERTVTEGGMKSKENVENQSASPVELGAKLKALDKLINDLLSTGSRILIFSQFVTMLSLIREQLDGKGLSYCYLDGSQGAAERNAQVSAFQCEESTIPIFLMSLKAGGYGLTLTGADSVVHFDPWWNPAVEAQATDRAHRIGQTKPVTSYKLIVAGSVEQKILKLQKRKRLIADVIIDDQAPLMDGLSGEDIRFLLS
ncbi:MAG: DEAD/DEAH box helicase [Verrucomicrobiales bacterium]|nr:DEAD/DEAH box helicase [Verrucomicrobiales bacterium]